MKYLISIVGPTASGKTQLAVKLATELHTAVISADSRQVFRGMDIGTAKASAEEMKGVKHYCIDELNPDEVCNAGWFGRRVEEILKDEYQRTDVMVMAGGSGLYLHAVWKGFDEIPPIPEEIRTQLIDEIERKGLAAVSAELEERDPETFQLMDQQNPQRVVRALEVLRHTGIPISQWRKGRGGFLSGVKQIWIGIDVPRKELYERIDKRVDQMMEAGLQQEAMRLAEKYGRECAALHTLGYKELIFPETPVLEDAVHLIKRNSRRFAKRQMTWFRRYPEIKWFPHGETAEIIRYVHAQIRDQDET